MYKKHNTLACISLCCKIKVLMTVFKKGVLVAELWKPKASNIVAIQKLCPYGL